MTDDKLTPKEAALLVLLMAEARDLSNTELRDTYRLSVDRKNLNRLGYVETDTSQRPHVHRLTDAGWARCSQPLDLESSRARAHGAALSSLLAAVLRHLDRSDLSLADFVEGGAVEGGDGAAAVAPARSGSMAQIVRDTYHHLATEAGAWVSIADLRSALHDFDRDDLDDTLRELERDDDVSIVPESNQKALTEADRGSALWIGGQYRHAISITR
jgi:hypothetical protein